MLLTYSAGDDGCGDDLTQRGGREQCGGLIHDELQLDGTATVIVGTVQVTEDGGGDADGSLHLKHN